MMLLIILIIIMIDLNNNAVSGFTEVIFFI